MNRRKKPRASRIAVTLLSAHVLIMVPRLPTGSSEAHAAEPDPWFGRDKALHYGASFTLGAGGYGLGALVFEREPPRVITGSALSLGLGIAKEIADRYTGGHPSWRDLGWDVLGTASGVAVAWLIDRFLW